MSVSPNGVSVRERKSGIIVLAVIGGIGLLLSVVGAITTGAAGFFLFLGITVVVLGLGAVIVGRPAWALIGSRKAGAGVLAFGVVLAVIGGMLAPAPEPKVVEPQALLEPLTSTSTYPSSSPATTSTTTSSPSASPTPTVNSAALASSAAAVAAAAESERLIAEQAAQAAVAEASRIAAEAAQVEADRVLAEASAAAQAEANRVAAELVAQAEAARQAQTLSDQQEAQRNASGNSAPSGGYANCAAARAAGAAPVHRGEPGYAPRLDGDNDGIGCDKG